MILGIIQKAIAYTKEVQEVGLFGVMADSRLFAAFSGSPFYYVMLPFIGILLTLSAAISGYQLAIAENKNFDKWFGFIVSGLCAVLASVSLYGAVIASAMKVTFAAGPWFFLSSVVLAGLHQAIMLGINAYRAYESLSGSAQRMHFIQAALNNAFILGLLTAISGAITFVMLTPVAPFLGTACALTAVLLTGVNLVWRMIPYNWKLSIKELFHLNKPIVINIDQLDLSALKIDIPDLSATISISSQRLFSQIEYSSVLKTMELSQAHVYIKDIINRKIELLNSSSTPKNDKNIQKLNLLTQLSTQLNDKQLISKADLLSTYPLAFQSFWSEKGDVEQIFDAVLSLQDKHEPGLNDKEEHQTEFLQPCI
ncbi:hypothetical protein [Legionella bononiensis]|uniref:Uncharacterized protein n=1 Tax=Legionella bononiensis TaxID=2793102 RepID=A0ABS1WCS4_9GAMM|nr:hypothetical protein [Legionella bononiensis]MBL7479022.1 hypothetical protein [Legionella bononiensis]MBL7527155.1 hypothetical protein [Legionella bononiensis]MBL7562124.1 hypothetical protein [Legionella bononiensis]